MAEDKQQGMYSEPCWRHIGVWGNQDQRCVELDRVVHCQNCEVFIDAAREVFSHGDGQPGDEPSTMLPTEEELAAAGDTAVVPFRLAGIWLGVPPEAVHQFSEIKEIRSIPHRSNEILLGIAALQGELVACIDFGRLFELPESDATDSAASQGGYSRFVVLQINKRRVAFAVNAVMGVHRFFRQAMQPAEPESLPLQAVVEGQIPLGDKDDILYCLNMDALGKQLEQVFV